MKIGTTKEMNSGKFHIWHVAVLTWTWIVFDVKSEREIQIFRNDEPFEACTSLCIFFKFIEDQCYSKNMIFTKYFWEKNRSIYYIHDKDLENIFDSKTLVDVFWKILGNSFNLGCKERNQISDTTFKIYVCQILSYVSHINITCVEKLKLINFLIYGKKLKNSAEFVLKSLIDKNRLELRNKFKVLEYIIPKMYTATLEFEKSSQEYERFEHERNQMTRIKKYLLQRNNKPSTITSEILDKSNKITFFRTGPNTKRRTSIMLELRLITNLISYIHSNVKHFTICKNQSGLRNVFDLALFCKLIAILPCDELREPVNVDQRNKLVGVLQKVLSFFKFSKLKPIKKRKSLIKIRSKVINTLQNGGGIYYQSGTQIWIHIGRRIEWQLKEFKLSCGEVFWKVVANLCYAMYGIENVHITMMSKQEEKQVCISPSGTINFTKYGLWNITNITEGSLSYMNYSSLKFYHVANNDFVFDFSQKFKYSLCFGKLTVKHSKKTDYSVENNESDELLLPLENYIGTYRFCDKTLDYVVYHLKNLISYKISEITLNLTNRCDHIKNSEVNESLTSDQLIFEMLKMLATKLETDDSLEVINIYTDRNIFLGNILDIANKAGTCKINIFCSCNLRENCLNKAECASRTNKNIFFTHVI